MMSMVTVSAARATLDANKQVARLIEAANLAIIEAYRAAYELGEPMAANLFGVDDEAIKAIGQTSKSKLLPVLQTGVPIWSSRLSSTEAISVLAEGKTDPLFNVLLKTFSSDVPLNTL
jgi:hypothetical protein